MQAFNTRMDLHDEAGKIFIIAAPPGVGKGTIMRNVEQTSCAHVRTQSQMLVSLAGERHTIPAIEQDKSPKALWYKRTRQEGGIDLHFENSEGKWIGYTGFQNILRSGISVLLEASESQLAELTTKPAWSMYDKFLVFITATDETIEGRLRNRPFRAGENQHSVNKRIQSITCKARKYKDMRNDYKAKEDDHFKTYEVSNDNDDVGESASQELAQIITSQGVNKPQQELNELKTHLAVQQLPSLLTANANEGILGLRKVPKENLRPREVA